MNACKSKEGLGTVYQLCLVPKYSTQPDIPLSFLSSLISRVVATLFLWDRYEIAQLHHVLLFPAIARSSFSVGIFTAPFPRLSDRIRRWTPWAADCEDRRQGNRHPSQMFFQFLFSLSSTAPASDGRRYRSLATLELLTNGRTKPAT